MRWQSSKACKRGGKKKEREREREREGGENDGKSEDGRFCGEKRQVKEREKKQKQKQKKSGNTFRRQSPVDAKTRASRCKH